MEYNVKHDEKRHRFEYDRNGLMAFVEYDLEDGVMDIFHTLVPIPMEGMGVGSALMKYALDYARDHNYSVIPNCAFAQAFLLRHTNYRDLIS